MTGTLSLAGELRSPYDPAALPLLRAMPGARWDPDARCWRVSTRPADRTRVLELAGRLGLQVDPALANAAEPPEVLAARARAVASAQAAGEVALPYQLDGVAWLAGHPRALLADGMGLGKTAQTLWALPEDARTVVVAPASVKRVWAGEAAKWRPDLRPVVLAGRQSWRLPEAGEIIIINFDILPAFLDPQPTGRRTARGKEIKEAQIPDETRQALAGCHLILDEVHKCKNFRTKRSGQVRELSRVCRSVWALSGTPLPNRPFDLYGVLDSCAMVQEVFSWPIFIRLFGGEKNSWGGWEFAAKPEPEAAERLRRVMIRRRKEEVLPQLPPRRWTERVVDEIDGTIRAEAEQAWDAWLKPLLDRLDILQMPPFEDFSAVRAQLAAAKIPAALEIVEEYEEAEEPLVVFSCHRAPVDQLGARPGWGHITGDDSPDARAETVRRFQAGQLKGVALTIQAGGVGITLTRASHVLVIDQPWNPADLDQAVDRVHRIGQDRPVQITILVADVALDRHVAKLLRRKEVLIHGAIEATAATPPPPKPEPPAPREQGRLSPAEIPPAGRYALPTQNGAVNELAFWIVDRPDDPASKWHGWIFLRQQIGPALEKAGAVRPDGSATRADAAAVLRRIAEDAEEALRRYGRELGVCGCCGLPLTNDESRAAGIGPICIKKL